MSFSRFFARRIAFKGNRSLSRLTVLMAVGSIAIGIAVMEVSLSVTRGFQNQISSSLVGFTGHVQVAGYMSNIDDSLRALSLQDKQIAMLPKEVPEVQSISAFIQKDAILKSPEGIEGIRALGMAKGWDSTYFQGALTSGRLMQLADKGYGREVVLGQRLADLLNVKVGDKLKVFFEDESKIRSRKVTISGIYETGFAEFDQAVVLCDIGLLQRILGLKKDKVQGFSIKLSGGDTEALTKRINEHIAHDQQALSLEQRHGNLFQWLNMVDQTLVIIIGLMVFVAVLNMAAALMILITERTPAIGLLKALGASGGQVQRIFLWNAVVLMLRGVLLGNVLAIALLLIQDTTGVIKLDADSYYLNQVAVGWPWLDFLAINMLTIGICLLCMWLPTRVAQRMRIPRALKFQ